MEYEGPRLAFGRTQMIRHGRVEHACSYCRRPIVVGDTKVKYVMLDDESPKIATWYTHPACEWSGGDF